MDARERDPDLEPGEAIAGEPAFFGRQATVGEHAHIPSTCPACGSPELRSEPALDDEEEPTGLLLVTCAACSRELGRIAPPERAG